MIESIIKVPAYQSKDKRLSDYPVVFVDYDGIVVCIEVAIGIGRPELIKAVSHGDMNQSSAASGEAKFNAVDYSRWEVDFQLFGCPLDGIGWDGETVIIEHTTFAPLASL